MAKVRVGILVRPSLEDRQQGRRFFELMKRDLNDWLPDRYGISEPVQATFSFENIESILTKWMTGFLFTRRKPRVRGHILMGSRLRGLHDVIYFSTTSKDFEAADVRAFVTHVDAEWGVDLAYVHVACKGELDDLDYYDRCIAPFGQGLTTHQLRNGLPSVAWAMYFGRPYIELLGRERLLSAPVSAAADLGQVVYVQLTPSVTDCARDAGVLRKAATAAMQHLGEDVFAQGGRQQAVRRPTFSWT